METNTCMFNNIIQDIGRVSYLIKGGAIRKIVVCMRTPGIDAILTYRFGHWLLSRSLVVKVICMPLYLIIESHTKSTWGIDISRHAKIGVGLFVGHYGGIVISPFAVIGNNFSISQGVTIGFSGKGENMGAPTIGNDVYIGAGAKIIGKIRIGNNVKIGANAVVYKDVPDNAIVVLDPGFKIISFSGNRPVG